MFSTTPNFRSTCIHRRVWVIWLWRCDLTLPVVSLTVACLMDRSRHSGEKAGAGSHCSCTLGPIMVSPPYLLSCGQHGRSSHSAKSVGKVSDGLSLFTLPILLHCIFSVRLYCWAHTRGYRILRLMPCHEITSFFFISTPQTTQVHVPASLQELLLTHLSSPCDPGRLLLCCQAIHYFL